MDNSALQPAPDAPAPSAEAAAGGTLGPVGRLALHTLQGLTFLAAVGLTGGDPLLAVAGSVMVAFVHWLAFLRANPRIVGLILIVLLLTTYYDPRLSHYASLWVGAGALGGAAGAWLSLRPTREDDFYFLPLAATVAAIVILAWLAGGCRIDEPLRSAAVWLDHHGRLNDLDLAAWSAQDDFARRMRETWQTLQPWLGPLLLMGMALVWGPMLWMAGRLARRWTRQMDPRRGSLILFRIEQRYIFLLICAILLWILGILTDGEKTALYVVAPLLTVFATACLVEGLAVALFYLALWRTMLAPPLFRIVWLALLAAAVLLTTLGVVGCILLGLGDIWFDFRRVKLVEERLGIDR